MEDSLITFGLNLQKRVGKPMHLRFNENTSTMVSISRVEGVTRVSLHKMFAQAPEDVLHHLVRYVQGKQKSPGPVIRDFIEENYQRLDYSARIRPSQLFVEGSYYNLRDVYDTVNKEYFDGGVDLNITWYGRLRTSPRQRVTFGLYYDPLRLIKVHKLLDSPLVPRFFIEYIVYHEMLHHVLPGYTGSDGRRCVHHPEFQSREAGFKYFEQAKQWIRDNEILLFG
ncbi:MAG: hypothetical protein KDK78_05095 [Chlamydiia bacterium]|nr:hypothetical protein [Chlamydiia bacterium]